MELLQRYRDAIAGLELEDGVRAGTSGVQQLGKLGLAGILIPEEYGGVGASLAVTGEVVHELSALDASLGMIMGATALAGLVVDRLGTPEQKKRILTGLADGTILPTTCITEREAGTDIPAIRTVARRDGDGWHIVGGKGMVTSAGLADIYFIVSRYKGDDVEAGKNPLLIFAVPKDTPGLEVGEPMPTMGLDGCAVSNLTLDVHLASDALLGDGSTRSQYGTLLGLLNLTRLWTAGMATGVAQAAFDRAQAHAARREMFGKRMDAMQGVQFSLAEMWGDLQTAKVLRDWAATIVEPAAGADRRDISFASSLAKWRATDLAMSITTSAVQMLGGWGYMAEGGVEKRMRDAKSLQIFEGANEVHKTIIGGLLAAADPADYAGLPDTSQQAAS